MGCCIYIGCGMATTVPIFTSDCPSLVTPTGSMTPKQIACGLPGQCPSGPGGAQGFPCCVTGTGVKINKCGVKSSALDTALGSVHAAGQTASDAAASAWCTIKKDFAKLPGITTILIVLFVMVAILIFVYGYARSR